MIYTYNANARKRKTTEPPLKVHIVMEGNKTYCKQRIRPNWVTVDKKPPVHECISCVREMNEYNRRHA